MCTRKRAKANRVNEALNDDKEGDDEEEEDEEEVTDKEKEEINEADNSEDEDEDEVDEDELFVVHELAAEGVLVAGEEDLHLFGTSLGGAALPVHGADLHRNGHGFVWLTVHRDDQRDGFGVIAAVTEQVHMDNVVGVVVHDVGELDAIAGKVADQVLITKKAGFGQRIATHGARGDLFGHREVLLHQGGRNRQHIADIVEAVARIVGRKLFGSAEIHAQQVADSIRVLRAVETMGGNPAGIDPGILVGRVELVLDELEEGVHLLGGRSGNALGRHFPGLQLGQDRLPALALAEYRRRVHKKGKVQAAGGELGVVAATARVAQDGQNVFFKRSGGGSGAQERTGREQ